MKAFTHGGKLLFHGQANGIDIGQLPVAQDGAGN